MHYIRRPCYQERIEKNLSTRRISRKELRDIREVQYGQIQLIFLEDEIPYYLRVEWIPAKQRWKVSFFSVCCEGFEIFDEKDMMWMHRRLYSDFKVVSVP